MQLAQTVMWIVFVVALGVYVMAVVYHKKGIRKYLNYTMRQGIIKDCHSKGQVPELAYLRPVIVNDLALTDYVN